MSGAIALTIRAIRAIGLRIGAINQPYHVLTKMDLDSSPSDTVGLGLVAHISFLSHQELAGLLAFLVLALATFVLYLQSECLRAMS